jgi:transcriptional regulator GlxA family with amidase domain
MRPGSASVLPHEVHRRIGQPVEDLEGSSEVELGDLGEEEHADLERHALESGSPAGWQPWIRRASTVVRRMSSVCSGAFVLAATGLLDGKRALHPLAPGKPAVVKHGA